MTGTSTTTMTASREEMKANRLPLGYRDQCSALLIPLNKCRRKEFYLPWQCEHERHEYEQCQYLDFVRRSRELSKKRKEELEE